MGPLFCTAADTLADFTRWSVALSALRQMLALPAQRRSQFLLRFSQRSPAMIVNDNFGSTDPLEQLDLVAELRLRSWARENFVPLFERSEEWHPVILDEMNRRDQEQELYDLQPRSESIVPLDPRRFDAPEDHTPVRSRTARVLEMHYN